MSSDTKRITPGGLENCTACAATVRVWTGDTGAPVIADPDPISDEDALQEIEVAVATTRRGQPAVNTALPADVIGRGLTLYRWHHDTCRRNRGVPDDPAEFRKYLGLPE